MDNFTHILNRIKTQLESVSYDNGDVSDVGNEIGIIITKYFDDKDFGWDKNGFIDGLNHGISLTDGTHG